LVPTTEVVGYFQSSAYADEMSLQNREL